MASVRMWVQEKRFGGMRDLEAGMARQNRLIVLHEMLKAIGINRWLKAKVLVWQIAPVNEGHYRKQAEDVCT